MSAKPSKTVTTAKPEDQPIAWFAVLERARIDHDFARAAEANRQLERLGVRVSYRRATMKTDARVIASAPELLDACISVCDWMAHLDPGERGHDPLYHRLVELIAKATGGGS